MTYLRRLTAWVGRIGPNPTFVAANAHCWFAFSVLSVMPSKWTAVGAVIAALAKEFWWDLRFETPKQTWLDSLEDFAGYLVGILLACLWWGLL